MSAIPASIAAPNPVSRFGPLTLAPIPLDPVRIGLVNGMPGEARERTARQFRAILAAASAVRGERVELHLLSPDGPAAGHDDLAGLDMASVDGLIVTGMPPRAAALRDEPCWPRLTGLVDLAASHAIPTVWSCLAAHVAVLHLDGIERRRLPAKLSGIVACTREACGHPLADALPGRWRVPHSRFNDLPEAALRARGYHIVACSPSAGVDMFAKDVSSGEGNAPFLFFQGHPEYDADTLLREYRRDVRQFLAGERAEYPAAPQDYLSAEPAALLAEFRELALRVRHVGILDQFPLASCAARLDHPWRDLAVRIYAGWLAHAAARRSLRPGIGTTGLAHAASPPTAMASAAAAL